ncbi:hypothetical protein ASF57_12630 [Methylobacterium sp. Leaf117]|nr:hypothetical protein ASF57_12630 [Methylobacterium sp. Leaf117]
MAAGIGIRTGLQHDGTYLYAIDADTRVQACADIIRAQVEGQFKDAPTRIGEAPKALYVVRCSGRLPYTSIGFDGGVVEILGNGKQFVASAIHPGTLKPYRWPRAMRPLADLPICDPEEIAGLLDTLRSMLPNAGAIYREGGARRDTPQGALIGDPEAVETALGLIPNVYAPPGRANFVKMAAAVRGACQNDYERGLELFVEWAEKANVPDPQDDPEQTYRSVKAPFAVGAPWLFELAEAADLTGKFKKADAWALPWFDEVAAAAAAAAADEARASAPAGEASPSTFDDIEPIDIFGDADPSELDTPPDGAIPPIIGPWARDEARRKGVPLSLPVMAALSVIGAAIGCSLKIRSRLHDKREEPASLWVIIVADPGSVKSPVISAALDPLRKMDRGHYQHDKPLHDAWAAKKRPRGVAATEPEPKIRRCVVDDATIEQQIRIHADNPRGLMRAPDEFAGLLGSLGAYKKGAQVDRSMVLRMFDGESITVDRVSGGNRHATSGLMGVLAGTQPDVLRELTRDLGTDGLLQRAIFILYDGRRRPELDAPPDHAAAGAYARAVRTLGVMKAGSGVVELSPEAYAVLTRAEGDFRALSDLPGVSKAWQGHIAKWGKLLFRLTLICHALRHVDDFDGLLPGVKVDKETAEQAVLLGRFVLRHSLRFYEDYFDTRAETSEARKIAGYILTKPGKSRLSHRDLYEARKELRGADRAKIRLRVEIMGELERAGWCAVAERGPDGPVSWLINPKVRIRFEDRAAREVQDRNSARQKIIEASKARKRMNTDTLSDGEA